MLGGRDLLQSLSQEISSTLVARVINLLKLLKIFSSRAIAHVDFRDVVDRLNSPISIMPRAGTPEAERQREISGLSVEDIIASKPMQDGRSKASTMAPAHGHHRTERNSSPLHVQSPRRSDSWRAIRMYP
jgi:hypothetical protein